MQQVISNAYPAKLTNLKNLYPNKNQLSRLPSRGKNLFPNKNYYIYSVFITVQQFHAKSANEFMQIV